MAGETMPSTGKTVAVTSGAINAANHVLFVVMHVAWGYDWADAIFCSDVITLAVALAGLIMHCKQRKAENAQINSAAGVVGGPSSGA